MNGAPLVTIWEPTHDTIGRRLSDVDPVQLGPSEYGPITSKRRTIAGLFVGQHAGHSVLDPK
jgi:hypothetical protein